MKKFLERLGQVLYVVCLLSLPVYNAFIEKWDEIDGIMSFLSAFLVFVGYLIVWWFACTPIYWLVAALFWPGEDGKEIRKGCLVPISFIAVMFVFAFIGSLFQKKDSQEKKNSQENKSGKVHGLYAPTKPSKKTIKDDEAIPNRVYICTGPQSKRYHRSPYCIGLNNCSDVTEAVEISTAEEEGKTPCGICY